MTMYVTVPAPPARYVTRDEAAKLAKMTREEIDEAIAKRLLRTTADGKIARHDVDPPGRAVTDFTLRWRREAKRAAQPENLDERIPRHNYLSPSMLAAEMSRHLRRQVSDDTIRALIDTGEIPVKLDADGNPWIDRLDCGRKILPAMKKARELEAQNDAARRQAARERNNVAADLRARLAEAGASEEEIEAALARLAAASDPSYEATLAEARAREQARMRSNYRRATGRRA